MSSYRNIRDLIAHLASSDPLLYEALNRIDSQLSEPDILTQTITETIATSNTGWIKSGSNVRLDSPGDFVGVGTVAPTKRFSVAELVTIDDAGRVLAHAQPTYDMAAGVFGAGLMIDPGGVYGSDYGGDLSIASGQVYAGLNITGTFPAISPGAVTEFTGLRAQVKNNGGNLNAETRAIIGQARVTGAGHGRGIYAVGMADPGATGFINALSIRTQPVATLLNSYGIQIQNFGASGKTKAIYLAQDDATSDYTHGLYIAPGTQFTDSAIQLPTGSNVDSVIRWDEMFIINSGLNILEIGTFGLYPISFRVRGNNGSHHGLEQISEEITLSTVGTTTDSAADLLPTESVILAVAIRLTQAISGGGVTGIHVGDATTNNRFRDNLTTLTLGTSRICLRHFQTQFHAATDGPAQPTAGKIRITTVGGTPTQGKVRVTVFYSNCGRHTS